MTALEVLAVGPLATLQDLGRPGHAAVGVSAGGAADRRAVALANRLVGNPTDAAALEVVLGGLVVRAQGPLVVAVAGAPARVSVQGRPVDAGRALTLRTSDVLAVGVPRHGLRSYLAVRGGFVAERLYGSASCNPTTGVGPPPVAVADALLVGDSPVGEVVPVEATPAYRWGGVLDVRVVLGPRADWFTAGAVATLGRAEWVVTSELDRVGIRLSGPALERSRSGELLSEPLVRGALQVPPSGQPLVFGPDHPTTGGYPVMACVVDADLDPLAQLRPGDRVRFTRVPAAWS